MSGTTSEEDEDKKKGIFITENAKIAPKMDEIAQKHDFHHSKSTH
jgi:hypothetical protein